MPHLKLSQSLLQDYKDATEVHHLAVDLAQRAAVRRWDALEKLVAASGWNYTQVAGAIGLSSARVSQIMTKIRRRQESTDALR